mmetsp:Transcript_12698/g.21255  ORF Transcript_12698/g.21255 Transcript_12698/m.21255 type:complete len:262 (+) Transcript_12698:83-868(+)
MRNLCIALVAIICTITNFGQSFQLSQRQSVVLRRTHCLTATSVENNRFDEMGIQWKKVVATVLSSTFLIGGNANAGFFTSAEQDSINEIQRYQKPVAELLDQLRPVDLPNAIGVYGKTQVLRGGKDDADVVLNYVETYIKPCQQKMEKVASKLQLPDADTQKKVEITPLEMKGHILELGQAIEAQKADFQAKEVEEVQETLGVFLKLASTKYEVKPFIPSRPLTDAELFGPLGCEFWGKVRIEGSNQCTDKPTASTTDKAL